MLTFRWVRGICSKSPNLFPCFLEAFSEVQVDMLVSETQFLSCGLDDNNFRFFVSGSPELKIAGYLPCTTKVSGEFGASKVKNRGVSNRGFYVNLFTCCWQFVSFTEAFDSFEAVWAALRLKVPYCT